MHPNSDAEEQTVGAKEEMLPVTEYPLRMAYDGQAFVEADYGTGKGAQLQNLLGRFGSVFLGLAPEGPRAKDLPLLQRGTSKYLIWQQTTLPEILREQKPQIFLAPYNTAPLSMPRETKLISVVHDLVLLENLTDAPLRRRVIDAYRAILLIRAIKRSSLILTVSNFTANEIHKRYPSAKIRVIHCTVDESWFIREKVVPLDKRDDYILIVTSNRAHKNVPRALEAFARFKALAAPNNMKMRMVGVSSSAAMFGAMAKKLGIGDSVLFEPFLSVEELQQKYRHASCVIIPSRMEGFGIPALEAMSSGTPLVCSNTWSLPEVGGDVPLYFDPTNVEQMAHGLYRACTIPELRETLARRGLERAELFHPNRIKAEVETFWMELPNLYSTWKMRN